MTVIERAKGRAPRTRSALDPLLDSGKKKSPQKIKKGVCVCAGSHPRRRSSSHLVKTRLDSAGQFNCRLRDVTSRMKGHLSSEFSTRKKERKKEETIGEDFVTGGGGGKNNQKYKLKKKKDH